MAAIIIKNLVYVYDNDNVKLILALSNDPKTILTSNNIKYSENDNISHEKSFFKISTINIERSHKVNLIVDGQVKEIYSTERPLIDILIDENIIMQPLDLISKDVNTIVKEDMDVTINRVAFNEVDIKSPIPFEEQHSYSPLIKNGQTKIVEAGTPGEKITKMRQKTVDGVVVEEAAIGTSVIKEPKTQKVLVGNPSSPISNLKFDGKMSLYKKGAVATAYSAKKGAKTASGMNAGVGYVAVNAKKIPYGTKLYIEGANGSFIYGYAVAADTGGFALDNKVDVDLFFQTYEESCIFGKQAVNIYIVN